MGLSRIAVFLLAMVSITASAQTDRYMVFFTDKTGTPHSIGSPTTFLSARAINRRIKANVAITTDDLPVVPGYVTQVRATGAKAFFTTRWFNGVLVEATSAQVSAIEALGFVGFTEFVAPGDPLIGGRRSFKSTATAPAAASSTQLTMLALDNMHADGYQGSGVLVAVLDAGFPGVNTTSPFQALRDEGRIIQTTDFIRNSSDIYQYDDHGTVVLGIMTAGTSSFAGGAPSANYLLYVTEDAVSEYRVEEYNWLFAAERADSAGADVLNSSLGYNTFDDPSMDYTESMMDGNTTIVSRAASKARDRGIAVVVSAGNLGGIPWQLVAAPADVDGVLGVGAVDSQGARAAFSSVGPSSDGRIKPDVVALGVGVNVFTGSGAPASANGTSMSAPLVTSLVAGLIEAFPQLTATEIVAAVKASASQSSSPDNELGYGIPGYTAARNYLTANPPNEIAAVYPNPVVGDLSILFQQLPEGSVRFSIYNAVGKIVHSSEHPLTWSVNPLSVPTDKLSPGIYLLHVQTSSYGRTLRFVKL